MPFETWFRNQYGSHQKGFGLCEADLKGAWEAARSDEIERLRAAGSRLYAAIGEHLGASQLPQELKDAGQNWTDTLTPNR